MQPIIHLLINFIRTGYRDQFAQIGLLHCVPVTFHALSDRVKMPIHTDAANTLMAVLDHMQCGVARSVAVIDQNGIKVLVEQRLIEEDRWHRGMFRIYEMSCPAIGRNDQQAVDLTPTKIFDLFFLGLAIAISKRKHRHIAMLP